MATEGPLEMRHFKLDLKSARPISPTSVASFNAEKPAIPTFRLDPTIGPIPKNEPSLAVAGPSLEEIESTVRISSRSVKVVIIFVKVIYIHGLCGQTVFISCYDKYNY
jgi:hypothetical protein